MTGIFISYRREDAAGWTGRLAADLRREFRTDQIFQDIASIEIGEDFLEATRRSLASCAVAIVVIGPRWLHAKNEAGHRRLDDTEDWVRLEIAESLQREALRVVPVLVGEARMPRSAELPEPLKLLARRNALEISDSRWDYDFRQLVVALRKFPPFAGAATGADPDETRAASVADVSQGRSASGSADLPPGTVFRDGDDCPEMVVIPAGEFTMGSPEGEPGRSGDEGPLHEVVIARPFAVGRYVVTFDEWDACVAAGGCAHEPGDEGWGRGRRPVIHVSWDDAQAYAAWLSKKTGRAYRLLSEAEWEYAARAGTTTRYPWGDAPGADRANFYGSGSSWSGEQTAPVGSFDANRFGLHDVVGNVWEWVQDCWTADYEGAPADGRARESGDCSLRVARGGAWVSNPGIARVANRDRFVPGDRRLFYLGFRVARDV